VRERENEGKGRGKRVGGEGEGERKRDGEKRVGLFDTLSWRTIRGGRVVGSRGQGRVEGGAMSKGSQWGVVGQGGERGSRGRGSRGEGVRGLGDRYQGDWEGAGGVRTLWRTNLQGS